MVMKFCGFNTGERVFSDSRCDSRSTNSSFISMSTYSQLFPEILYKKDACVFRRKATFLVKNNYSVINLDIVK